MLVMSGTFGAELISLILEGKAAIDGEIDCKGSGAVVTYGTI